jgi:hypothetical protein
MHDQIRPERPKYHGYYALSALDQIVFSHQVTTRSASLRACPWLSYFAPLALCFDFLCKAGFKVLDKAARFETVSTGSNRND